MRTATFQRWGGIVLFGACAGLQTACSERPDDGARSPSCPDGMALVRAGPGRSVCLDLTEVTTAAYQRCVDEGECRAGGAGLVVAYPGLNTAGWENLCTSGRSDRAEHPVNCVGWAEADAYCRWRGARLPTDSEWLAGAGAEDARPYAWGWDPPSPARLNAAGRDRFPSGRSLDGPMYDADDGYFATAPVGSFPLGASAAGLLDMAGNVWEWTAPDAPVVPLRDPAVGARDDVFHLRGGSFAMRDPEGVRVDARAYGGAIGPMAGFRCAMDAAPSARLAPDRAAE